MLFQTVFSERRGIGLVLSSFFFHLELGTVVSLAKPGAESLRSIVSTKLKRNLGNLYKFFVIVCIP